MVNYIPSGMSYTVLLTAGLMLQVKAMNLWLAGELEVSLLWVFKITGVSFLYLGIIWKNYGPTGISTASHGKHQEW